MVAKSFHLQNYFVIIIDDIIDQVLFDYQVLKSFLHYKSIINKLGHIILIEALEHLK